MFAWSKYIYNYKNNSQHSTWIPINVIYINPLIFSKIQQQCSFIKLYEQH